jgi:hypothetical protein
MYHHHMELSLNIQLCASKHTRHHYVELITPQLMLIKGELIIVKNILNAGPYHS